MFVSRKGFFLERDIISKEASGSQINHQEIQESEKKQHIVDTSAQLKVDTHVEETDIPPHPIFIFDRIRLPPTFYGFHIAI